jgi:hypothetical protein
MKKYTKKVNHNGLIFKVKLLVPEEISPIEEYNVVLYYISGIGFNFNFIGKSNLSQTTLYEIDSEILEVLAKYEYDQRIIYEPASVMEELGYKLENGTIK